MNTDGVKFAVSMALCIAGFLASAFVESSWGKLFAVIAIAIAILIQLIETNTT